MGNATNRGWVVGLAMALAVSACGDDDGGTTPATDGGGDATRPNDLGAADARVPDAADAEDAGGDARVPDDAGTRVETTIGAAGGELRSSDGRAVLTIPAGALDAERMLSIERIDAPDADVAGAIYAIEPSGVTFARSATLRIDASADDLGAVAPELVALSTETATGWEMIDPQVRTELEGGAVTVIGLLAHLSRYAVSFVHHQPRGECAECLNEDWDACCLAGRCSTGSAAGALGLVQGECRMTVVAAPIAEEYFPTIEGFQVCYGLERGHPIGPCSTCQVECALEGSRVGGPTTVLGWRPLEAGSWSTAEVCTAMRFYDPMRPGAPDASDIADCFRECDERGEGNRTCPPGDRDAGPPIPPDAGTPDAAIADAGPADAGPADTGAPDAGCACDVDPICESTCLCDPDCSCTASSCASGHYCDPDLGCTECRGPPCASAGAGCDIDLPCGVPIGRGICVAFGTDCLSCMCPP